MKSVLLYLLLMIFSSCQSSLTHDLYNYGDEFVLGLGDEERIGSEKVSVKFVDVLEDSRCPSNVTCVWAGNGKVQLRFAQDNIQLNTYLKPHEATLGDVNIQLLSLDPYPEHPRQFEKDDYKVRLLITKK